MAATADASDDEQRLPKDDDDEHKIVKAYVVEYYCHLLWDEFQSLGRLKSIWMLIFAADVWAASNKARRHSDANEEKGPPDRPDCLLILLMFYLTEKTDVLANDDELKDCTQLELAMRVFERLVRLECVRRQLDDRDLKKMRILLKEQSVLVCWKNGDYELARAVCDRQYHYFEDLDVQKSLDKLHRALLLQNTDVWSSFPPYSDLIEFSKDVIRKVLGAMSPPALLTIVSPFMQHKRDDAAAVDLDASIKISSPSQLPTEEQDCSTDSEGVGSGVRDQDPVPVQLPPVKKTSGPSAAEGRAACESVIVIQPEDSDSEDLDSSVKILSSSPLPTEEQDCSTDSEGVGPKVQDQDLGPVQFLPPKETPGPNAAAGRAACESAIVIQPEDSDSDVESRDERPAKKITQHLPISNKSSSTRKKEVSTSRTSRDCDFDFDLFSDDLEEVKSHKRKKRRRPWTAEEEVYVYKGVQQFGVGKWKEIALYLGTGRSNVDVKDKWRNLEKLSRIHELKDLYGPI